MSGDNLPSKGVCILQGKLIDCCCDRLRMWLVIKVVQAFVLGTILALKSGYNALCMHNKHRRIKIKEQVPYL